MTQISQKKVKKNNTSLTLNKGQKTSIESRGILDEVFKKKPGEFQFATSNVLWRASLITLEEIPLRAVDYSGGIIVTEWYTNSKSSDSSGSLSDLIQMKYHRVHLKL